MMNDDKKLIAKFFNWHLLKTSWIISNLKFIQLTGQIVSNKLNNFFAILKKVKMLKQLKLVNKHIM